MSMNTTSFNPREHLMTIKNRQGASDYLPVQWRLVWFRNECPEGTIETEIIHLDLDKETEEEQFVWNPEKRHSEKVVKTARGVAVFKATVKDGKGGVATGTKMEKAASFSDFLEKAETGAIGRALAGLGYGTQFAPELNEEHRIVDAPVDFQPGTNGNGSSNGHAPAAVQASQMRAAASNGSNGNRQAVQNGNGQASVDEANASISERQLTSIRKLCEALGKSEPENVTSISYLNAKKVIQQLTAEYRQQQNKAS